MTVINRRRYPRQTPNKGQGNIYIAKLAQAKLSERSHNLATDFVGDVELHHAHFRRAERRVLSRSHDDVLSRLQGPTRGLRWGWEGEVEREKLLGGDGLKVLGILTAPRIVPLRTYLHPSREPPQLYRLRMLVGAKTRAARNLTTASEFNVQHCVALGMSEILCIECIFIFIFILFLFNFSTLDVAFSHCRRCQLYHLRRACWLPSFITHPFLDISQIGHIRRRCLCRLASCMGPFTDKYCRYSHQL